MPFFIKNYFFCRIVPTVSSTKWKLLSTEKTAVTTLVKVNTVVQTQTQNSKPTVNQETEEQLIMKKIFSKPPKNGALRKFKTVTVSKQPKFKFSNFRKVTNFETHEISLEIGGVFTEQSEANWAECCQLDNDFCDGRQPGARSGAANQKAYDRLSDNQPLKWKQITTGTRKW